MKTVFTVTGVTREGHTLTLQPSVCENGNTVTVTIPRERLCNPRFETLIIHSSLTTAHAGDRGYMFFPTNFYYGFALCRFDEKPNTLFRTWPTATTVCGICENENAVFVRVQGQACDARFYVESKDGSVTLYLDKEMDRYGVNLHTDGGTIRTPEGTVEADGEEGGSDFIRSQQDVAGLRVCTDYGDIRIREKS